MEDKLLDVDWFPHTIGSAQLKRLALISCIIQQEQHKD